MLQIETSSREDSQFKRDLAETIRQSNELFAQSAKELSQSMLAVVPASPNLLKFCHKHYLIKTSKQVHHTYIKTLYHPQTQHSLMQCSQPQKNVAQFQPFSFSSEPDSANSQGGEFTTLMDSELRRDNTKRFICYNIYVNYLSSFVLEVTKVTKPFFCLN